MFIPWKFLCVIFYFFGGIPQRSSAAHILFLHPLASPSHLVVTWPLVTALHSKGNHVTVISSVSPPSSFTPLQNVTWMHPKELVDTYEKFTSDEFSLKTRLSGWSLPLFLIGSYIKYAFTEALLSSSEVQNWLASDPKVDLVVVDLIPETGVGIAEQLNSKVIFFLPVPVPWEQLDDFGAPFEMISSMEIPHRHPLTFLHRLQYLVAFFTDKIAKQIGWHLIDGLNEKYLSLPQGTSPSVEKLLEDVSLVFHNSHFLENHRKSLPPNFISLPGLHIHQTHNPLAKEIEDFIRPFKGFVYISLGTVVKLQNLPEKTREDFFGAIRSFPEIAFLWKWDVERPQNVPENLFYAKWFQQQDVLGHTKVFGMITQAGRPSLQEAMYNAVPTITFPVIGDQDYNAVLAEELGVSINLDFSTVTKEILVKALQRLVNREFKVRCRELSDILRDVPMNSVDTGVWWMEYVLRHNDVSHLRPFAAQQTFFVRWLLDVWVFLGLVLGITAFSIFKLAAMIIQKMCKTNPVSHKKLKLK